MREREEEEKSLEMPTKLIGKAEYQYSPSFHSVCLKVAFNLDPCPTSVTFFYGHGLVQTC